MKTAARVFIGIVALMMIGSGLVYMFNPDAVLSTTQVRPDGLFGRANIRANMGGPMVTFGAFLALGAYRARKDALLPFIVFASLAILARITGLGIDGYDQTAAVQVGFMVVLLAFVSAGYMMLHKVESQKIAEPSLKDPAIS